MTNLDTPENSIINQKVFNAVSTVVVSLMMGCVAITLVLFGGKLSPNWELSFLPIFCTLIALERMVSTRRIKRLLVFSKSWFFYHSAQWTFVLIILKVILLISHPPESLWLEAQLWRVDIFTYFFNSEYLLAIILVGIIWMITGYLAHLLDEMSLEEALIRYETAVAAPVSTPPVRERLLGTIFAIGFILVILTALMRIDFRMLFEGNTDNFSFQSLPYLAAGAWNVLLYFLLGLILMSQSQFARLNARWRFQKIEVTSKLAGQWALYSALFIIFLALLASILPTNYSLGILSVIGYVLRFIFGIIVYIIGMVWMVVASLFNLILSLLGITSQSEVSTPPTAFTPPEPPIESPITGAYPWLELIKSLVFWMVFIGIVGFSIVQFVRQHEGILTAIRGVPGLSWLSKIISWLFGGLRGINERISLVVESGLERFRNRRRPQLFPDIPGYINLRRLRPRQRVYFFFLAMIRRGGERGITRTKAQTPYEYANTLKGEIPDVEDDVTSLTKAFVDARYSRGDFDDEKVHLVKRFWERIRGALRAVRK
jgi:hypothetical protein